MKIRTCFVSNSSSESFVVYRKGLTKSQRRRIVNAKTMAPRLFPDLSNLGYLCDWYIHDRGREIHLYTSMNNFNMREYLEILGLQEGTNFQED